MALGLPLFFLGELASAREHTERGIALYDPQQHRSHAFLYGLDPGVICLSFAALACGILAIRTSPEEKPRGARPGPGAVSPLEPGFRLVCRCHAPSVPPGGTSSPRAGQRQ